MPQVIAAIVTFVTWVAGPGLAAFAVRTAIVFGISKLMTDRAMKGMGQNDAGGRVQLPPATDNILPLIYGKAYVSPVITDAKISTDQKTMWYCCTLSEVPASGSYTFGDMYWNGNKLNFSSSTSSNVNSMTNNAGQTDYKAAGKIQVYKFPNGSASGITIGGTNAITVMSDIQIPANLRWNSTLYTAGGKSAAMTNTCFFIVKLTYNVDADTTGLGTIEVELTNSIDKPGDVILDYLQNTRYGCAIPLDNIDTASLTALNTYSDELITYDSAATPPVSTQQARYRINGPVNLGNDCLTNLQEICDACDSWLQYSDIEDKWKIVMNKPFEGLESNLYHVTSEYDDTSANLVGGIQVNPIDLNASYNSMQVAYPSASIRDQVDYQIFDFTEPGTAWYAPELLSPNEPDNKLDVEYPQVNNYIQAAYLGVRKLLQSREDLVISFQTDYSGIQVQAGDVIRVSLTEYGWTEKLFRVSQVSEIQDADYTLYAKITAFEYNASIYTDNALTDFVPADNTGLSNTNIIANVQAPEIRINEDDSIGVIECVAVVPNVGSITQIDFNWGEYFDSLTHDFYTSIYNADGSPLTAELNPGFLSLGKQYRIKDLGNTDFSLAGATKIDLANQPNLSGFLTKGQRYIIDEIGTTDFTVQGAPNNNVGTTFVANSSELAVGTGKVYQTDFYATDIALAGGLGSLSVTTGLVDTIFSVPMVDLPPGNQYWSITAKTPSAGVTSGNSNVVSWSGPTVTSVEAQDGCGVSSSGTTITFTTAIDNINAGGNIAIDTSNALYIPTGVFASNTFVTKVVSNTEVIVNTAPTTPLSNDCIKVTYLNPRTGQPAGGITAGAIHTGTITSLGDLDSLTVAGNINFYGPNVALGAVGNMEITGGQNGYFLQTNGAGDLNWAFGTTTGNGVVGGANRQIQYNNDGNFAGSVGFEFDSTTSNVTVPNYINSAGQNGNAYLTGWTSAQTMGTPSIFMGKVVGVPTPINPGETFTANGQPLDPFSFTTVTDSSWTTNGYHSTQVLHSDNKNYIYGVYGNTAPSNPGYPQVKSLYFASSGDPNNWTRTTISYTGNTDNSDIGRQIMLSLNDNLWKLVGESYNTASSQAFRCDTSISPLAFQAGTGNMYVGNAVSSSGVASTLLGATVFKNEIVGLVSVDFDPFTPGSYGNYVSITSSDGNTWTDSAVISATSTYPFTIRDSRSVMSQSDNYVFFAEQTNSFPYGWLNPGKYYYSSDGLNWTSGSPPAYFVDSDTANGWPIMQTAFINDNDDFIFAMQDKSISTSLFQSYLIKSTDLGATWTSVGSSFPPVGGIIVKNSEISNVVYGVVPTSPAGNASMYTSSDGGVSWTTNSTNPVSTGSNNNITYATFDASTSEFMLGVYGYQLTNDFLIAHDTSTISGVVLYDTAGNVANTIVGSFTSLGSAIDGMTLLTKN